jgi:hypothetical protein
MSGHDATLDPVPLGALGRRIGDRTRQDPHFDLVTGERQSFTPSTQRLGPVTTR